MHCALQIGLVGLVLAASANAQVFHVSARVTAEGNTVFMFAADGAPLGSYPQADAARHDAWGYRDGASDGEHAYFGWSGGVARHEADGSNPTMIITGEAPGGVGTWRALAFDPSGNAGHGSFWVQSFLSSLIETSLDGALLTHFAPNGTSISGLAYDDSDGHLWAQTTGGEVIKINTDTGQVIPSEGWPNGFAEIPGGLSGFSELDGNIAAVTFRELGVYDVAAGNGSFAFPPFPMGHRSSIGVAVTPERGCDPCDTNCDWAVNAFDIEPFLDLLFDPNARPCNTCTGDVNHDGLIDAFDIEPFLNCLFP